MGLEIVMLEDAKTYKTERERTQAVIKKWERIVQILNGGNVPYNYAGNSCAYCVEYLIRTFCNGCPIREKTHKPSCYGTPYIKFEYYVRELTERFWHNPTKRNGLLELALLSANRMLKFLKDLAKERGEL